MLLLSTKETQGSSDVRTALRYNLAVDLEVRLDRRISWKIPDLRARQDEIVATLPRQCSLSLSRSPETSCADGRLSDRGRPSSRLAPHRRSKVPSKEATAAHHTRRNLRREDYTATQSLKRGVVQRGGVACVCGRSGSASTFNSGLRGGHFFSAQFGTAVKLLLRISGSGLEVDRELMTTTAAAASATPALVTGR